MTNKMIAKSTIIKSALKYLVKMQIEEGSVGFAVDNDPDHDCCWDDILSWLEAQPCEDCINCISRESIKQKLQEHRDFYVNAYGGFSNLPQNYKSRVDEIDNCIAMVVNEPSVTPQRPKGKWIKCKSRFEVTYFKCSECERKLNWIDRDDNYCNNCGSDNSESTKEWFKEWDTKLAEMSRGGEDES